MLGKEVRIVFCFGSGPVAVVAQNSLEIGEVNFRKSFPLIVIIEANYLFNFVMESLEFFSIHLSSRSQFLSRLIFF